MDNSNIQALVDQYKITPPTLVIPVQSSLWAKSLPDILTSFVEDINQMIKKIVISVDESINFLNGEIRDLKDTVQQKSDSISNLQDQIRLKQLDIDQQDDELGKLQDSITKNETYSRRDNLIFGGIKIKKDDNRPCSVVLKEDVFRDILHMGNAKDIKFVRCHYLKSFNPMKATIIVRFEHHSDRIHVWERRRTIANANNGVYVSEDFPIEVSKKRNKLKPILRAASRHQEYERIISIKHDKLLFDGRTHCVDKLHSLPTKINPKTLSEKSENGVLVFGGINSEYHEFSNFYNCGIKYKGVQYNSAEQAYQHQKAIVFSDTNAAHNIMRTSNASRQKFLGSTVKNFNDVAWRTQRDELMKHIVHAKFTQNQSAATKLKSTKNLHLGEAIMKDKHFGTGLSIGDRNCTNKNKWSGKNILGELLMAERTQLAEEV